VKVLLLGMNHRSAPLEVRERYAVEDTLPALHKLVAQSEIEEVMILSTCNRVEVVATTRHLEAARLRLGHFFSHELAQGAPLSGGASLDDFLYEHRDHQAICHVFRVASAMDSMVVGEPQILGQVKEAYRASVEAGACGPVLSRLFQHAFATAKRVKNETRISEGPVSVARVAVDLARQIFEDFSEKTALLIGAGEMIELSLAALQGEGLSRVRVANRTRANAEELAERFGATPHGLDDLEALLPAADIVLSCVGGDGPLVGRPEVEAALRVRRNRPIFFIDIGVPRNVHPDVNSLDNVYLYDIDDLQEVSASNAEERRRETANAERIVLEEQQRFDGWLVALQAVPTIRHLRARAEAVRRAEIERYAGRLPQSGEAGENVEALTRGIVNKILHAPLARLRAETDREEGLAILEAARTLFGLDDDAAPGAEIDAEQGSLEANSSDGADSDRSDGKKP